MSGGSKDAMHIYVCVLRHWCKEWNSRCVRWRKEDGEKDLDAILVPMGSPGRRSDLLWHSPRAWIQTWRWSPTSWIAAVQMMIWWQCKWFPSQSLSAELREGGNHSHVNVLRPKAVIRIQDLTCAQHSSWWRSSWWTSKHNESLLHNQSQNVKCMHVMKSMK